MDVVTYAELPEWVLITLRETLMMYDCKIVFVPVLVCLRTEHVSGAVRISAPRSRSCSLPLLNIAPRST